jgi:hypothetical protein
LPEANISASSEQSRSSDCEKVAPSEVDHSKTPSCFLPSQNAISSPDIVCRTSHLESALAMVCASSGKARQVTNGQLQPVLSTAE